MSIILKGRGKWIVRQKKEWAEILVDFESRNKYEICNASGNVMALAAEKDTGFGGAIARVFLRKHRGFQIEVFDPNMSPLFTMARSFFWFFSSLSILGPKGRLKGEVHRRFGILNQKYDLVDGQGRVFARIQSPVWRLWRFPIRDTGGQEVGEINKRWGGGLREIFTDADTFLVDVSKANLDPDQQYVALAAAIAIDFDFFEENDANNSGVFDLLGD